MPILSACPDGFLQYVFDIEGHTHAVCTLDPCGEATHICPHLGRTCPAAQPKVECPRLSMTWPTLCSINRQKCIGRKKCRGE